MRTFLSKVLLFFLVLGLFIGLMFLVNRVFLGSKLGPFKIKSEKHVLVLGNSQMNLSFDETYLPEYKNYAHGGDPYFYSYIKLKQLKELNPQIDTLFLGFNSRNISTSIGGKWFLNETQLNDKLKLYLPLLNTEELHYLYSLRPKETLRAFMSQSLIGFQLLFAGRATYGEGSESKTVNKLKSAKRRFVAVEQIEVGDLNFDTSKHELYFLNKIVDYCKREGIALIFINPPVHHLLWESVEVLQPEFYAFYFKHYPEIPFYDYGDMKMKDECFNDLVHMSAEGAAQFSMKLKKGELLTENQRVVSVK
ncbi:hypothetical protein [Croceimicrobium hydrocarbonivorans]|uniref:SGNH/GDSL hydrolase family protein n=1 Tax=Croceimicrobium hydrocarbonivorans TaxID=2761580 RepID=A0A7H0VFV9_9FLAO|nr:hypothetical protein [Croceimicrobium hydrocarbonivorans]QNR24607.1 hypothetical protein H4K34_01830 [Croceimicrobium hydrocarbonivorans]